VFSSAGAGYFSDCQRHVYLASASFSDPEVLFQVWVQVVAFIKGTRTQPQCDFSYKVLTMLNEARAEYEVVNVLDERYNPGVREAIKSYSQWPTIPQVCELLHPVIWDGPSELHGGCGAHCIPKHTRPTHFCPECCCVILAASNRVVFWHYKSSVCSLELYVVLQLYIKGEFVGGADIIEEMNEKGELKQMLR